MTSHRSKHVALLDKQTLLSKYTCVMTGKNFVYDSAASVTLTYGIIQNKDMTGQ